MTGVGVVLGLLAVWGIIATGVVVARDGYRRVPATPERTHADDHGLPGADSSGADARTDRRG